MTTLTRNDLPLRTLNLFALLALVLGLGWTGVAEAQSAGRRAVRRQSGLSGVELGLEGALQAPRGGTLRWLLSAYEVVGLQDLRPAPRATISLTTSLDPTEVAAEVTTDQYGRATLELALPEDAPPSFRAVLTLRSATELQRRFELTVTTTEPRTLQLSSSRPQVRPGGLVHVFGRLFHGPTGRPLAQESVSLVLRDSQGRQLRAPSRVVTDRGGLFARSFRLPRELEGAVSVEARAGDDEHPLRATTSAQVSSPQAPPMLLAVATDQVLVGSRQAVPVEVALRTPNGRPIAGAQVILNGVDDDTPGSRAETDGRGRARLTWNAPRITAGHQDFSISVTARREGYGQALGAARVRVAATDYDAALAVEGGALIPELGGRVYVRVVTIDGRPAPAAVPVTLRGPRVRSGRLQQGTDPSGVATFDVELVELATDATDRCGGDNATALTLEVGADPGRQASLDLCLPLDADGTARVRVSPPVATPGGRVTVEVARSAIARQLPVSVALLARSGGGLQALSARVLAPGEDTLELELPSDVTGQVVVRARPLQGAERQEVRGGSALLWVSSGRPAQVEVTLSPSNDQVQLRFPGEAPGDRSVYLTALPIDEAQLLAARLHVTALGPLGDLRTPAAQATEALFAAALSAAVPRDAGAPALLRPGEGLVPVPAPEDPVAQGLLRDPWRSRARFVTGRLALIFRAIEEHIEGALPDRLDDVAIREGTRWQFNSQVVEAIASSEALSGGGATGLGGEPLTIEALQQFDRAFTYDNVARRITRERLFRLILALRQFVQANGFDLTWSRLGDPAEWLRALPGSAVPGGQSLRRQDLVDGWGRPFELRRARSGRTRFTFVSPLGDWEMVSTGPDGRAGTGDDLWDPTARVLPADSAYAEAVGEDVLVARLRGAELGRATIDLLRSTVSGYQHSVGGVPSRPEAASEQLTRQLWQRLPLLIEPPLSPLSLRRPSHPGDGALGRVVTTSQGGGAVPLGLDEEPRTWGVVAYAWTEEGFGAVGLAAAVGGSPLILEGDLPRRLRLGERASLPLQLTNLLTSSQAVQATVRASNDVVEVAPPGSITLGAEASTEVTLSLEGRRPGHATIELELTDAGGRRLRRLEIPLLVVSGRQPVRLRAGAALTGHRWRTRLAVPGDAVSPLGRVVVLSPEGLSADPDLGDVRRRDPALVAWAETMSGRALSPDRRAALFRAQSPSGALEGDEPALSTACALFTWSATGADDEEASAAFRRALAAIQGLAPFADADGMAGSFRSAAAVLAAVAPGGVPELTESGELAADEVGRQAAQLRAVLRRVIHLYPEEPTLLARAAAALLLADPRDGHGRAMAERAFEHLEERAGGALVTPSERRTGDREALSATLALAIAAHQLERTDLARSLIQGALASENVLTRVGGEPTFWYLAAAAYGAMGTGAVERVEVQGEAVALQGGRAVLPLEGLSPGRTVSVSVARIGGPTLLVRAEVVMGRPFEDRDAGPLRLELQGDLGGYDEVAALELSVTADRPLIDGVLDVQLPSGLDAREGLVEALERSDAVLRAEPRHPGFLRVWLSPLTEGQTAVIPLPIRWTLRGDLRGLGVMAYPESAPEAMTVLAPRALTIQ